MHFLDLTLLGILDCWEVSAVGKVELIFEFLNYWRLARREMWDKWFFKFADGIYLRFLNF